LNPSQDLQLTVYDLPGGSTDHQFLALPKYFAYLLYLLIDHNEVDRIAKKKERRN